MAHLGKALKPLAPIADGHCTLRVNPAQIFRETTKQFSWLPTESHTVKTHCVGLQLFMLLQVYAPVGGRVRKVSSYALGTWVQIPQPATFSFCVLSLILFRIHLASKLSSRVCERLVLFFPMFMFVVN